MYSNGRVKEVKGTLDLTDAESLRVHCHSRAKLIHINMSSIGSSAPKKFKVRLLRSFPKLYSSSDESFDNVAQFVVAD